MMNKVIRDGKVAVLYSPRLGGGWYTWNTEHPEMVFHPRIVEWVENGKQGDIDDLIDDILGEDNDFYSGGGHNLKIEWLYEGTNFIIQEYEGNEWIETPESLTLKA